MCLWKERWALGRAKGEEVRRQHWRNLNSKRRLLGGDRKMCHQLCGNIMPLQTPTCEWTQEESRGKA